MRAARASSARASDPLSRRADDPPPQLSFEPDPADTERCVCAPGSGETANAAAAAALEVQPDVLSAATRFRTMQTPEGAIEPPLALRLLRQSLHIPEVAISAQEPERTRRPQVDRLANRHDLVQHPDVLR